MGTFVFNGVARTAPCILVKSIIGASKALALLPFGTLCFIGASDGGVPAGIGNSGAYKFNDIITARKVLRGGALLTALETAANLGGAAGFIAVVVGDKVPGTATLIGASSAEAVLTAGDGGTWTNEISITIVPGTEAAKFAAVITFPDSLSGATTTIGGKGSRWDNLTTIDDLAAAVKNDAFVTPAAATGLAPLFSIEVTSAGALVVQSQTFFSGGLGDGNHTPVLAEVQPALDNLDGVAFDIGHIVGVTDPAVHAYADAKSALHEPYGILRRFIHQGAVTGTSATNTKAVNSAAIVNSGVAAAAAINYYRSNLVVQKLRVYDLRSGSYIFVDGAVVACGLACIVGATDQWGPASPLTHVPIPSAADVDYTIMEVNGDLDTAIAKGVMVFEVVGLAQPGAVRMVQSVTTQPLNPQTGQPWILAEFSGVRVADAVLANIKGGIEAMSPRTLGGGNSIGTMNGILAQVVTILERAVDAGWLSGYDQASVYIASAGPTGTDDLLYYSITPTPPLNHIGITQTLLPYSQSVSLTGGAVSG